MQQHYFLKKHMLCVFAVGNNQYFNFIYEELKKYFKSSCRLNSFEYFIQHGIRNTEKYIENLISEKKIDIIFSFPFSTSFELDIEFYNSLKNKTKIVFWMFDDCQYFNAFSKYYCQIADCVISYGYYSHFAYKELNIPVISFPSVFSKKNYYPIEIEKDIDVSFLGDCNKNDRMKYISFLINKGINVETFGRGSKNGFVKLDKIPEIFSRSKINLNFTKLNNLSWINKDDPLLNRVRNSKGRPFEIAFTKSFCLSEYSPDLEVFFEIGKEVDVFYNEEDLLEKIDYYLSNDIKREEMAQNAYKRAIKDYEVEVYLPKMLRTLEEILEKRSISTSSKIFLSNSFKIKSIIGLTIYIFISIKNKNIRCALGLFKELFKYGIFCFFIGFYGGITESVKYFYIKLRERKSM